MIVKSFGDLICAGQYSLHSSFSHFRNFISPDREIVGITTKSELVGPANILLSECNLKKIDNLKILQDRLHIEGEIFAKKSLNFFNSDVQFTHPNPTLTYSNCVKVEKYLQKNSPPESLIQIVKSQNERGFKAEIAKRLKMSFLSLEKRDYEGFTKGISGVGFGLTPSGDDYLCGVLFCTHILEKIFGANCTSSREIIYTNAISKRVISNHFLKLAKSNRAQKTLKSFILTLTKNTSNIELIKKTKTLQEFGLTSGSDLCWGIVRTLILNPFK